MLRGIMKGVVCSACGGPLGVRNKLGCCIGCRTYALRVAARSHLEVRPHMAEKVAYYEARAALGLPLFEESPWSRLPGGHQRHLECQTKTAGTTGRIATADKIKQSALHDSVGHVSFPMGGGRQ